MCLLAKSIFGFSAALFSCMGWHMKRNLFSMAVLTAALAVTCCPGTRAHAAAGTGSSFKGPIGLQLYSLRDQFAKDVPGTLDQVRSFGIEYVELAGTYNLTPEKLKEQL